MPWPVIEHLDSFPIRSAREGFDDVHPKLLPLDFNVARHVFSEHVVVSLALVDLVKIALTDETPTVRELVVHVARTLVSSVESNESVGTKGIGGRDEKGLVPVASGDVLNPLTTTGRYTDTRIR